MITERSYGLPLLLDLAVTRFLAGRTANGDFAYYVDIAHFMADLPRPTDAPPVHWLDSEQTTRRRWITSVEARRTHLSGP